MRKNSLLFLFFAFPLGLLAQQPEVLGWKKAFVQINQDVQYRGRSYEALKEATEKIGHRLTGTPNARKAEEFVYQTWKSYQLPDVKYMPFEVEAWSRSRVTLSFAPAQSDNFRDVEVVALAHSPVSAHLTAEVVDCGDGLLSDFTRVGERLKGKVALFNINIQLEANKGQKNLHRSEKTALAIQFGAAGVVIANSVPGGVLLTGTASVTGELIPIPAVCISLESGKALRKWMQDEPPILAILDMQNFSRPIRARNVVATIPGTSRKHRKETIVIGGHLDSWDLAVGAMDNGVGSFSVLDIARVFQSVGLRPKRTIEFVLFMGEEQGLLGSRHMVQKYAQDKKIDRVKLMLNLDMVNNVRGFNAMGNDQLRAFFDEVGALIQEVDTTYGHANSNRAGLHSDHQPFMLKGIPTASPSGTFPVKAYNCYHANCDRLDLIDRQHLQNNVRFTAMMLYALASVDKFPEKVKSQDQTKEFLIQQGLKQELIIGKDWPFSD